MPKNYRLYLLGAALCLLFSTPQVTYDPVVAATRFLLDCVLA